MARGHDRERDLKRHLEACDWVCIRAAGSLGPVDIVAIARAGAVYPRALLRVLPDDMPIAPRRGDILLVESKSTSGGPYERFGPAERRQLADLAAATGAMAVLAYKPKGAAAWAWVPSGQWPAVATVVGTRS